jgi:hypothetical protein
MTEHTSTSNFNLQSRWCVTESAALRAPRILNPFLRCLGRSFSRNSRVRPGFVLRESYPD